MMQPIPQAHLFQEPTGFFVTLFSGDFLKDHGQLDVLQRRERRDEIERLEDEPDFPAAQLRKLIAVLLRYVQIVQQDPPCGGQIEPADEVEQGALA
jgi:hypothetical protein